MADLRDLIDRFDRLVTVAGDLVPEETLADAAQVGRRARDRRGYLGESVVVALAGGTGSGKSSLVNALAGEVVAETGAQRPTTLDPMAWIPVNPEPGLVRLLDAIGVTDHVGHDDHPWLAVIDLPDTDSVSEDNRATVERVLPLVDAVVWVVDPEKYQDRVLHERYLRPLARHADRFLFVLNQVDRIEGETTQALVEDLAATLHLDGIGAPTILAVAADPPVGGPIGIDGLVGALRSLGDAKTIVEAGLTADLDTSARELVAAAGIVDAGGTGFSALWDVARNLGAEKIIQDLLGPETAATAGRLGARHARLAASIRAKSMPSESVPVSPSPADGTRQAVDLVDRMVGGLIETVGIQHAEPLRGVRARIEPEVAAAAVAAAVGTTVRLDDAPSWWRSAGWLRVVAMLLVGGFAYWLASNADLGTVVPVLVGVAFGVITWLAGTAAISASGRSWGQRAVAHAGDQISGDVQRELDRRIGRPLRDALRVRAGLAAAYTEFEMTRSVLSRESTNSQTPQS